MKKFYFLFLFALIASISNLYAAKKTVTFDATVDKSSSTTLSKDGITLLLEKGTATNCGSLSTGTDYRPYKGNILTISSENNITKIVFTCTAKVGATKGGPENFTVTKGGGSYGNDKGYVGTWTGSAASISFNADKQVRAKTIEVTYEFEETQCATPTFNLENGKTYTDAQTLVITSTTADATIHYTINGGEAKTGQPAEFTENGEYTVDAWATKDNLTESDHNSITFTIAKKCAAPTFSLASGSYTTAQTVTITGPEGSTITYTLNEAIFEAPSPVDVELPLVEGVSTTYNLSAHASMKDFKDSEKTKAVYVINELYADKTATLNIANYASANKWVSGTQYPDVEIDDVKFAIKGGGNDGKYYKSNKKGETWRVYSSTNGTLTISVPAMHIITSVVYKATNAFAEADSGTLSEGTAKGEWKWNAAATNTTEGDPVNSVIFTAAGDSNNVELKEVTVYYAYDPVSSVSSMSAEGVKVFAAEGGVEVVAAEATDVAVYTAAGQLVRQARVAEGSTLVNVAPGFYVVRANGTATKVIVR